MKFNTLKRTMAISAFGLAALLGTSGVANAQYNRQNQNQQQKIYNQQQKVDNQRARLEQQRLRLEQERLEKQRLEQQRAEQLRLEQLRQAQLRQQQQQHWGNRYRLSRNGRQYQVDNRQAELLKQAVNMGYQQGFRAGQTDRSGRRGGIYNNSSIYQNGNYGYQSYVDSSLYQYYFRQGFERGYEDGYNSRHQYGNFSNGNANILGTILQGILNLQSY
jgi:hypothetical protein